MSAARPNCKAYHRALAEEQESRRAIVDGRLCALRGLTDRYREGSLDAIKTYEALITLAYSYEDIDKSDLAQLESERQWLSAHRAELDAERQEQNRRLLQQEQEEQEQEQDQEQEQEQDQEQEESSSVAHDHKRR